MLLVGLRLSSASDAAVADEPFLTDACSWRKAEGMFQQLMECNRSVDALQGLDPEGLSNTPNITCPEPTMPADELWDYPTLEPDFPTAAQVWLCEGSDSVRGVRVGPVKSWPSKWTEFGILDLSFLFSAGERIQSYVGTPVTADGQLIGFPPLHVHHVHVMRGKPGNTQRNWQFLRNNSVDDIHFFNTHGDFSDGDDYGVGSRSARAYTISLPDGYGLAIEEGMEYRTFAIIDDVRQPDAAATVLDFYLDIVFEMAPPTAKNASYLWVHNPSANQLMYQVPNYTSIAWWTGTMPASGKMLPGATWVHEHRMRMSKYGLVVLSASLAELNFSCETYGIHSEVLENMTSTRVQSRVDNMTAAYERLLARHADAVICRTDPDTPTYMAVGRSVMPGVPDGSLFDRRGSLLCNSWAFARGDPVTVFTFIEPLALANAPWYPEHTVFHMYAELTDSAIISTPVYGEAFNEGCGQNTTASPVASGGPRAKRRVNALHNTITPPA